MTALIASDKRWAIVGFGKTGQSVARYLSRTQRCFDVFDESHAVNDEVLTQIGDAGVYLGPINDDALIHYDTIVLSPGVPRASRFIQLAIEKGVAVTNDIALFLSTNSTQGEVPVVGITGSNGKTTVTTLVGSVLRAAGKNVVVAGNIGEPILDVMHGDTDVYVLELSSFQLETIEKPNLNIACVLNVSDDHMDRYKSLADYCFTKQRIYYGARNVVYNLDDKLTIPPSVQGIVRYGFSRQKSFEENEIKIYLDADQKKVMCNGVTLMSIDHFVNRQSHYFLNAMAVVAICHPLNIDMSIVAEVLSSFKGLPHRCEIVATKANVTWVNDSKATNTGASIAAIESHADDFSSIILIAGGDGKSASFDELATVICDRVSALILIGQDAAQIEHAVKASANFSECQALQIQHAESLESAVRLAHKTAFNLIGRENQANDGSDRCAVLLSPACASMDMFSNYIERGNLFKTSVLDICEVAA